MPETPEHAKETARESRKHPRHHFRARSHASAHADHTEKSAPAIPQHPLIARNHPALLATQGELDELIEHVRQSRSFAYDSEFIGELSYYPKLCVIQVATSQRVALVDALAELDLQRFWELLADPSIEKIVHAGEQDLEPVHRLIGRAPANVFDTQVAAGFCGFAFPAGLSKLVRELVGVQLGKGFTFTHWDQRPLTNVQMRYAADDVRYLPALREAMGQRLHGSRREAWVKEECAALCDPKLHHSNPATDFLRLRGAGSLTPKLAAVLRELFNWREDAARRHDSPPRSFVKDEILLEMARKPVTQVEALDRVKHLPRPVEEDEGENIVAAVQRGLATPESNWPIIASTEETPRQRFITDSLWAMVQAWCHGHGIDPALVASRGEIVRFYRHRQNGSAGEGDAVVQRLSTGWRGELIGQLLTDVLAGTSGVVMRWQDGQLLANPSTRAV